MHKYTLIDSTHKFIEFRKKLRIKKINRLAIDLECESNLHCYGVKVCLIQVFDGNKFFVIDPFEIDPEEMRSFFESHKMIKIFFDAGSDTSLLFKVYGIQTQGVMDLKHMVDVLNYSGNGLNHVIEELLGIKITGKKKYQRYNWMRRPVEEKALQYALSDVEHLFTLYEKLWKQTLDESKAEDLLLRVIKTNNKYEESKNGIKKPKGYSGLTDEQKGWFEKIYYIRDDIARRLDFSTNNVITNEEIIRTVQDPAYLSQVRFSRRLPERERDNLIDQVRKSFD